MLRKLLAVLWGRRAVRRRLLPSTTLLFLVRHTHVHFRRHRWAQDQRRPVANNGLASPPRPRKVLPAGTDRPLGRSAWEQLPPPNQPPRGWAQRETTASGDNHHIKEQALGTQDTPQTDTRLRRSRPGGLRTLAERRRLSLFPLSA